ncbi:hypothetical protein JF50_21365 [Pseudoalteromonas luteoviolacea]|uniref:Uncharacterized protein n=1 Tax=Pseudoalteromonas luteoviolacea TaxID=43657 RepID=A0A0C1QJY5_9GAMM|nr:hypothetical protein JF50_21365 [Pseudoalteromonas luteoviolacea]
MKKWGSSATDNVTRAPSVAGIARQLHSMASITAQVANVSVHMRSCIWYKAPIKNNENQYFKKL